MVDILGFISIVMVSVIEVIAIIKSFIEVTIVIEVLVINFISSYLLTFKLVVIINLEQLYHYVILLKKINKVIYQHLLEKYNPNHNLQYLEVLYLKNQIMALYILNFIDLKAILNQHHQNSLQYYLIIIIIILELFQKFLEIL